MNENPSEPLLGVDVGTPGSMGVLARTDGEVVATSDQPHEPSLPHGGRTEHDAEAIWWKDFVAILCELPEEADGPMPPCLSGAGPCFLATGGTARPPGPRWPTL